MKNIGLALLIFGGLATVLGFMGSVPRLLSWIYNWGETTAWIIKIAMIVGGAVLLFLGRNEVDED